MTKIQQKQNKPKAPAKAPVSAPAGETLDEALGRAIKFAQAKDFDSANALFQRLLKATPTTPACCCSTAC